MEFPEREGGGRRRQGKEDAEHQRFASESATGEEGRIQRKQTKKRKQIGDEKGGGNVGEGAHLGLLPPGGACSRCSESLSLFL